MSRFDDNWKAISTPNKKFDVVIKVDGETIEDTIYTRTIELAIQQVTAIWTMPFYESATFELVSIKEVNRIM